MWAISLLSGRDAAMWLRTNSDNAGPTQGQTIHVYGGRNSYGKTGTGCGVAVTMEGRRIPHRGSSGTQGERPDSLLIPNPVLVASA